MSANSSTQSVNAWLAATTAELETAGIGTARLDSLVLLEDVTGKSRAWLLAHPEFGLTEEQLGKLKSRVKRRTKHEPLAYIRNRTEFYGREFYIDHRVLEPRPESETMLNLLKQQIEDRGSEIEDRFYIVDIGTGSGALAVTAKLEFPAAELLATDIDRGCLSVARKNAQKLQAEVQFLHGDLLSPISRLETKSSRLIILANLPYVPDNYQINEAALQEPQIAIFGGKDGLDVYRKMFGQIADVERKPTAVFTESLPFQHAELAKIAEQSGYIQSQEEDFIQVFERV